MERLIRQWIFPAVSRRWCQPSERAEGPKEFRNRLALSRRRGLHPSKHRSHGRYLSATPRRQVSEELGSQSFDDRRDAAGERRFRENAIAEAARLCPRVAMSSRPTTSKTVPSPPAMEPGEGPPRAGAFGAVSRREVGQLQPPESIGLRRVPMDRDRPRTPAKRARPQRRERPTPRLASKARPRRATAPAPGSDSRNDPWKPAGRAGASIRRTRHRRVVGAAVARSSCREMNPKREHQPRRGCQRSQSLALPGKASERSRRLRM